MPNMAYCRFENTLADLRDCQEALDRDPNELSGDEREARAELLAVCREIAADYPNDD